MYETCPPVDLHVCSDTETLNQEKLIRTTLRPAGLLLEANGFPFLWVESELLGWTEIDEALEVCRLWLRDLEEVHLE